MKRPLNPSHLPDNRLRKLDCGNTYSDCQLTLEDQNAKNDKIHQSFTLCEVCNIQLNSTAQAEIHYKGKSHQKCLKRLYQGKLPVKLGTVGSNSLLPALLRIPGRPLRASLDIKQLLGFRLNGNSTLSLFPNFNINQAEAHYKGHKHGRKLKAMEAMKQKEKRAATSREKTVDLSSIQVLQDNLSADAEADHNTFILTPNSEELSTLEMSNGILSSASPPLSESSGALDDTSPASDETLGTEAGAQLDIRTESGKADKKKLEPLYCATCKVTVNSASQLQAHNIGAKHKSMLRGQSTQTKRWKVKFLSRLGHRSKRAAKKSSGDVRSKAFHCSVCGICVNSETQLKQHMNSKRHRERVAGNPPKPKYSLQPKLWQTASLATELVFQKQFSRPLAARFLPSPLPTATVCAMPGPLTLQPATASTLLQAPLFGPALFRTSPGPLRASPIVFTPY
ncbi:zinc finger protein 385D isoform X2 [Microcaecilia unicolor]|uniref:Zinc finger protein 385D-like isoform X2 n=1 Tax=Microcaecilia unicolor TaxID=1415580 RepID=A0A6P7ZJA3_9AMPH|nr:zinc finger protein 385D-like isoform X2 [Microcaecilia unicolor]